MVKLCDFTGKNKGDKCRVCGWVLPHDMPFVPKRPCGEVKSPSVAKTLEQLDAESAAYEKYLGDWTKELLAQHGYTEDWFKALKAKHGFAPTCNCPERIEWLNNVDKTARSWKQRGAAWLRKKLYGV